MYLYDPHDRTHGQFYHIYLIITYIYLHTPWHPCEGENILLGVVLGTELGSVGLAASSSTCRVISHQPDSQKFTVVKGAWILFEFTSHPLT